MAWNPDPEVAALRDYAAKFNRPVVVAFSLHADGQKFQMVTFGKDKKLCKLAASFGDQIAHAVAEGDIAAPEIEPDADVHGATLWQRIGATHAP